MRTAKVFVNGTLAGHLLELELGKKYQVTYLKNYHGPSISLTMLTTQLVYDFDRFPPFCEGLLPEGIVGRASKTEQDRPQRPNVTDHYGGWGFDWKRFNYGSHSRCR